MSRYKIHFALRRRVCSRCLLKKSVFLYFVSRTYTQTVHSTIPEEDVQENFRDIQPSALEFLPYTMRLCFFYSPGGFLNKIDLS
jgi:hypothetical protein